MKQNKTKKTKEHCGICCWMRNCPFHMKSSALTSENLGNSQELSAGPDLHSSLSWRPCGYWVTAMIRFYHWLILSTSVKRFHVNGREWLRLRSANEVNQHPEGKQIYARCVTVKAATRAGRSPVWPRRVCLYLCSSSSVEPLSWLEVRNRWKVFTWCL